MEFIEVIENNKNKFLEFNKIKFSRFQQFVGNTNTKKIINSIPFLLSVNHKKFPGYVDGEAPRGIVNYSLDDDTKRFIRGKFPGVGADIPEIKKPFIQMFAIMGSIGTIAYNKKSDFDYWACIDRRETSPQGLENFRKKVDIVQKWASSEINLPVHIFINDVELLKQNVFAEDEEEAFGSTVGAVLKDEFLRSSIIISGKIPLWWVMPQFITDNEYTKLLQSLPRETIEKDFVDLGNMYEISKDDFLGAALFQIIKFLGNPFKSILKLGLLEKYLSDTDDSPLMSQRIKISIQNGDFSDSILDSYLTMFEEVYNFYRNKSIDKELVDMLRKNLYLKIDPQLSKYIGVKASKNIPHKVIIMSQMAESWKWDINKVTELDNFDNWDFQKVMSFWDSVQKFMQISYKKISEQLPELKNRKKISENDFMLLSRKIKTHFKREPDKIEQFITFKETPSEAVLYVEPVNQSLDNVEWRLYKRNTIQMENFITTTLKIEKNLLKLLAWTSLNQIYDTSFSRITFQSGNVKINHEHCISFLDQSSSFFKEEKIILKNDYFLKPVFNLVNFLILNFNIENHESIQTVHFLYHTSWGESFLKEYGSENDLIPILYTVLKDGNKLKRNFDNYCAINSPSSYKKTYKRISTLFKDAYTSLVNGQEKNSARFIANIGDKYVMFTRDKDEIIKDEYPNMINLLTAITLKPRLKIKNIFFNNDEVFEPLRAVGRLAEKSFLTIAYEEKGKYIFIYIMNEKGNLFSFIKHISMKEEFLIYLYDFCVNIGKRMTKIEKRPLASSSEIKINKLVLDRFGKLSIQDETSVIKGKYVLSSGYKRGLVVSISKPEKELLYNIIYPNRESSGNIQFKNLASVSAAIARYQKKGIGINTMVRDIIFNDLKQSEAEIGSTLYFLEKYKIESILEKTIKKFQ